MKLVHLCAPAHRWSYSRGVSVVCRTNLALMSTFYSARRPPLPWKHLGNSTQPAHSLFNAPSHNSTNSPSATTSSYRLSHLRATSVGPTVPSRSSHRIIVNLLHPRGLSRVINIALKKRKRKVSVPHTLRLIDEQGSNLGVVSSDIALKLAESKNLQLMEVSKRGPEKEAVYRLFTSKQRWEENKKKKKAAKSDISTKEMTIFTQIGEHDLSVKLSHLLDFLERGHNANVSVQTKYRRGMDEEKEESCRKEMVEMIESKLEGLGEKVSERPHQRRGILCHFRPLRK